VGGRFGHDILHGKHERVSHLRFLGKINPFSNSFREGIREMSNAIDEYLEERDYIRQMAERQFPEGPDIFLASITGARLINGTDGTAESGTPVVGDTSKNIWLYSWSVFGGGSGSSVQGSNDYYHPALNGAEYDNGNNPGAMSYGVQTSSSSPAVSLLPIGANSVEPVVMMYRFVAPRNNLINVYDTGGVAQGTRKLAVKYYFSAGNDVEVTC